MKTRSKAKAKNPVKFLIYLSLAGLSVLILWLTTKPAQPSKDTTTVVQYQPPLQKMADQEAAKELTNTHWEILSRLPQAKTKAWLLESAIVIDADQEQDQRVKAVSKKMLTVVKRALSSHRSIAEADSLWRFFQKHPLAISFLDERTGGVVFETHNSKINPDRLEIILYGSRGWKKAHEKNLLSFDHELGGVVMAALDYQDPSWTDALILHELWHAKSFVQKAPSATAPIGSDLWIKEELTAHDLESAVLDQGSKGAWQKNINEIASRCAASSLFETLHNVNEDDFKKLWSLYRKPVEPEVNIRYFQIYIALAKSWIIQRRPNENIEPSMIKIYRSITSLNAAQ